MEENEVEIILRAVDLASAQIQDVSDKLAGIEGKAQKGNRGMAALRVGIGAVAAAAAAAATAAVAIGGAGVKAAVQFEAGMANVDSLLGGNKARIDELSRGLMNMAPATSQGLDVLTEGLYNVVSAFGDTDETLAILELNARAAAAGLATTSEAIALTSAVTKGYGDTSLYAQQKVADLAFEAVRLGQTTFPELAASMGRVVPIATQLGVSQEELFAVMATATGVTGGAAEVSTQLRAALQSLSAPTESMTELFKKYGVSSGDALLESLGLQGAMQAIIDAAEESGQPLQKYMGSIEGQTLALVLAGSQADTYVEKLAAMSNASGSAALAFEVQQSSVDALMKQVGIAGNVLLVEIGQKALPVLRDLLHWVMSNMPTIQALFSSVFDQIGAAITAARDTVAWAVGEFGDDFARAGGVLRELVVVAGPVFDDLAELASAAFNFLATLWTTVLKPVWEHIGPVVAVVFGGVGQIIADTVKNVTDLLNGLSSLLSGDFASAWDSLSAVVKRTFDTILGIVESFGPEVVAMIERIGDSVRDAWLTTGRDMVDGLTEGIADKVDDVRVYLEEMATDIPDWVAGPLGIQSPSTVFKAIGVYIVQGLIEGISDGKVRGELQEEVQALAADAYRFARESLGLSPIKTESEWIVMGRDIVAGIVAGIHEAEPGLKAALARMAELKSLGDARSVTSKMRSDALNVWADPLSTEGWSYRNPPAPPRALGDPGVEVVIREMSQLERDRIREERTLAHRFLKHQRVWFGTPEAQQAYTDSVNWDPRSPGVALGDPGVEVFINQGLVAAREAQKRFLEHQRVWFASGEAQDKYTESMLRERPSPESAARARFLEAQRIRFATGEAQDKYTDSVWRPRALGDPGVTVTVRDRPEEGRALEVALAKELQQRQAMVDQLTTMSATNGPLANFGSGMLNLAMTGIPGLQAAFDGFVQGGPMFAVVAVFTDLLGRSQGFADLLDAVNKLLEPLVALVGQAASAFLPLVNALQPLVQMIVSSLQPAMSLLGWIVNGLANVISGVVNAIVGIWNFLFGWLYRIERKAKSGASTGLIAALQEERQKLTEAIENARKESTIAALNERLAKLDAKLARLRGLGATDGDGSPTSTESPSSASTDIGGLPPMLQFAIATPLRQAADTLMEAAVIIRDVYAGEDVRATASTRTFSTSVERFGDYVERLVTEGIRVMVEGGGGPGGTSTAALR